MQFERLPLVQQHNGRSHEVSTTSRQQVSSGMELRPIEHECNGPTRYREVVLTSWDRT